MRSSKESLEVVLEGFNEQKLNRELALLCEKLAAAPLQLPGGQYLKVELAENVKARPVVAPQNTQLSLAS